MLRYECRNNEWAEQNEPFSYGSHKAHCAVNENGQIIKVFKTKKETHDYIEKKVQNVHRTAL